MYMDIGQQSTTNMEKHKNLIKNIFNSAQDTHYILSFNGNIYLTNVTCPFSGSVIQ